MSREDDALAESLIGTEPRGVAKAMSYQRRALTIQKDIYYYLQELDIASPSLPSLRGKSNAVCSMSRDQCSGKCSQSTTRLNSFAKLQQYFDSTKLYTKIFRKEIGLCFVRCTVPVLGVRVCPQCPMREGESLGSLRNIGKLGQRPTRLKGPKGRELKRLGSYAFQVLGVGVQGRQGEFLVRTCT